MIKNEKSEMNSLRVEIDKAIKEKRKPNRDTFTEFLINFYRELYK